MARRRFSKWSYVQNPNYFECTKVLHEVADEYLKKVLDKLDDYLAKGYTHLRLRTLRKIPGCYSKSILSGDKNKIEWEQFVTSNGWGCPIEVPIFEINSVKKWLMMKYGKAAEEHSARYPDEVYKMAEKRCREMGIWPI